MPLIKEIDYGTPAVPEGPAVALEIDGFSISVPSGTSIMRAAMEAGIERRRRHHRRAPVDAVHRHQVHPLEVIRRNLVEAFPHRCPAGAIIDSGDYLAAVDVATPQWVAAPSAIPLGVLLGAGAIMAGHKPADSDHAAWQF